MKNWIISVIVCIFLSGCEDKKKPAQSKDASLKELPLSNKDSVKNEIANKPVITKQNDATIEEFLKKYGAENPERKVLLETTHGNIELELYLDTPLHRANFIYLIKTEYLNTTYFHRAVAGFIIQAGNSDRKETSKMRGLMGTYTLPPEIKHKHNRGALAAAKEYRDNPDDRSSAFEFYIVQATGGAHHLNPNYTVFGRVTKGMDVVDKIAGLKTDESEWPIANIFIKASVLD